MHYSKSPNDSEPPIEGTEAIHNHLKIQLQGVIIKFLKEVDEIMEADNNSNLLQVLLLVKEQVNSAYAVYCMSNCSELKKQTQLFYQECQLIIKQSQNQLTDVLDSSTKVKSANSRFFNEVSSLINYALNGKANSDKEHTSDQTGFSIPIELISTIKEKFKYAKQQFTTEKESPDEEANLDKDPPSPL